LEEVEYKIRAYIVCLHISACYKRKKMPKSNTPLCLSNDTHEDKSDVTDGEFEKIKFKFHAQHFSSVQMVYISRCQ
jgi:hypothetical protein